MLKFNHHPARDKDISYTSQFEDPCDDLFEQYLNQDLSYLADGAGGAEGFQAFDFAFDEDATSSESYSADSKESNFHSVQSATPVNPHRPQVQRTLPLRSQRTLVRCETPRTEITANELLRLEGKSPPKVYHTKAPSSSSSSSAAPTLRRKSKFYTHRPEVTGCRPQRVSKNPSSEMIRPSYHHRHESASYNEWTQRFEQISLQQQMSNLQTSPPREATMSQNARPNRATTWDRVSSQEQPAFERPSTHRSVASNGSNGPSATQITGMSSLVSLSDPPSLGDQQPTQSMAFQNDHATAGQEESVKPGFPARQLRHPSSWASAPPASVNHDFTISPSHVHPSWLHLPDNTDSFYENATASQTIPALEHPVPELSNQGLMIQYAPYGQFVTEEPSVAYNVTQAVTFPSTGAEDYPSHLYVVDDIDIVGTARPSSPLSRPSSVSPPPPPTPSKSRHTLKSRRKRSVGALRLPKSMGTLKSTKSARTLKSPKSAGALKSPKSPGQFGFVNFTADDSNRILTGVAPSGSSKTKARREQEANDKKRRLSQAALKAIQEAGGDVEKLKAEFDD
ncbi:hypothetical protein MMC28_001267 [Mycoblastus sanguinarius]|nr:hypothetical protein [Mycoblastus sanguinarius]